MCEAMFEKAREQRLKALYWVRQKFLFGGLDRDPEVTNVFCSSDAAVDTSNVVVFRHHQINPKSPISSGMQLH